MKRTYVNFWSRLNNVWARKMGMLTRDFSKRTWKLCLLAMLMTGGAASTLQVYRAVWSEKSELAEKPGSIDFPHIPVDTLEVPNSPLSGPKDTTSIRNGFQIK